VKLGSDWDGFTVSPKDFHDAGDTVVVEGRYTGSYKATGKSLDAQVTHVWRLRNSKVVSFRQYVDTAQLQDVMGARR
jgi:ketosteroid isomerase-like protein